MLLLDTHILLWYTNEPNLLSDKIKQAIATYDKICVSAISCFEINWLVRHNRIILPNGLDYATWIARVRQLTDIEFLNIMPEIASLSVELSEHHKDPADRLIIATALIHGCYLASVETKFPLYQELHHKLIN
ncbi:MAG: type II toxin-antitoxin system VapC family toxin [Moraxella sp.]|uniref:type II toxin-antitoxin system VapC family toxin n=1 Tax=Moraxella sp. TaxID=479 RepID=UPI0026DD8E16|nr:type II toxin-antitoxin system VapC family toxin [Moraxella sp.]MDO4450568.1 type II toxin-antitoxin system VapC family toxin [Moraxella sp.]